MLDNMNFFQNENCGNEYAERLRKSEGGVYPEQILYQLEASPGARCNLSTCPLVLKPTKLSNTDLQYEQVKNVDKSKQSSKKRKKHKQSKSRHEADKIKQVNMEESILTGLQTVIDLCGLLEKCEEQNKLKQSKNKCKQKMETNEQSVHNSCHLNDFFDLEPTMSINEPSSSKKLSNTTSIRKLFFRKSRSRVKNKELPSSSSITLLSQAVAGAESANESYYDQCLQILTSTKGSTHSQENAINKSNETHASPSSSKKSITSPNIVFVNNMKPIKEESQGPSKHYIKPQFAMHCRLSTTVNESNDHKGSTPSRDFCCAAPAVRKSRPVLRNKSSQDDIRYYWKTKSENAKAPLSPCNVCCMRPIHQKSRLSLRNKSEVDDIHYYQKTKNESEQARRIPHSHQSESLHSLTEEKPPRNASALALVKSSTTSPCTKTPQNSEEMHSNFCYRYNRGIVQKQSCCATASSEGSCHSKCCPLSNIKRETCLSTKCFPPVEVIPVCGVKSGHYTPHSSKQSYPLYKPHMDCKRSRHGIPTVQPVVGICRSGRCGGPRLKGIKYALVKISEFVGFNTYEIMKPYRDKPKNIPTCIAEIFVTSQKKNEKPLKRVATLWHPGIVPSVGGDPYHLKIEEPCTAYIIKEEYDHHIKIPISWKYVFGNPPPIAT
ncbi:hypothetical protein Trydic_g8829 [Trypoxylus dichotomus]